MKMTMKVTLDGAEEFEVTADLRDFREWEVFALASKPPLPVKPTADNFAQMTWVTRLAFTAARRAGLTNGDWAAWQSTCIDVTPDEQEEADRIADPTQPAA